MLFLLVTDNELLEAYLAEIIGFSTIDLKRCQNKDETFAEECKF